MTTPDLHQISLGPKAVSEALDIAHAFAEADALQSSVALAVIVEELVCNLVEHGRRGSDGMISIAIWRNADGVRVTLTDDCEPFDPRTAAPVGDVPPERGGGAGLALVRKWSQILSYTRADNRNVLELIIPDR